MLYKIMLEFFLFFCFIIYMWKDWFWKQSVSQIFSYFLSSSKLSVFALARKWDLYCTDIDLPYVCRWELRLYLLLLTDGGFNRE